jgi:RNA polymerase sigma factor (TIGR02999 family)
MTAATPPPGEPHVAQPITELLLAMRSGGSDVQDRLFSLVYDDLLRIARCHLARESADHVLESSDLVHEAYIRLVDQTRVEWRDRNHFYAVASRAMRRILVDLARRRQAAKRGGGWRPVVLEEGIASVEQRAEMLIALDEALERLERVDTRLCRVVEYRFFGGLSEEEMAAALGVTDRTIRRDWIRAKAWLYRELTA